ncbi:hypothetical protein CHGG_07592 [Chaetomium globosum CBS 148.51]|uniref:Trichothecene 3-O-acetyltransferase-like N-terminal domain-containing protein n=1 Tax=Chaetomium globosum (strain ATCC 6205 / CBS 148.51 / DSM 1962 / NBRC 6347 / NRRL 1970) TaxID=306901 RepID=Q2GWR2_CHAGB|nr:uncharacterized protein CHGG_07592 [Chaetomium globosum CBS 148.51]EAQ86339.1 hypothetical protein CHGG_07592 [Chaetomium globosum CBS 148.51]
MAERGSGSYPHAQAGMTQSVKTLIIGLTPLHGLDRPGLTTGAMASSTPQTALLSPLDQCMPRIYTTLFLVFETPDPATAVENLRAGLKRLNKHLPYLKGRVFAADGGRAALRWSPKDVDVELQEMPTDGVVLLGLSFEKIRTERAPLHYFPPTISPLSRFASLNSDSGAAVFAATYGLVDGGMILGLSVEHNVMDGTGVVELIRFWAACTRSDITDAATTPTPDPNEPIYRTTLLRRATGLDVTEAQRQTPPTFNDLLARHPEFRLPSTTTPTTTPSTSLPSPLGISKIFTISLTKLEATKTTLQSPHPNTTPPPTTNSILCATLWSCITRVRTARRRKTNTTTTTTPSSSAATPAAAGPEEEVKAGHSQLGFAINGRARLGVSSGLADPQRPFLGNVNLYGLAGMGVDVLGRATAATASTGTTGTAAAVAEDGERVEALARVVQAIGEAVGRVRGGFVGEVLELVERVPEGGGGGGFFLLPGWDAFHGMDVTVTSWANMGVYGVDFGKGVGKPCFMRVPRAETDGFVIVLPRRRGEVVKEEGIEVVVAMHPEDMAALEGDAVWRSYLLPDSG